jgi:hypothetical protein
MDARLAQLLPLKKGSAMFSTFRTTLDAEDRGILEIGMNVVVMQAAAVVVPLLMMGGAYFAMGRGPMGMPWYLIVVPILAAIFGFVMTGWIDKRTKVRVIIDSKTGKLLIHVAGDQFQIEMADVVRAGFDERVRQTTNTEDTNTITVGNNMESRLELVMKDGKRIPAGGYQTFYSQGDRAKMVAAINSALG